MKKKYLTIAVLALAIGLTACSSKDTNGTAASTATTEEAPTSAAADESDDEIVEENYYDGIVKEMSGGILTIEDDEGNLTKFDFSNAEISGAEGVGVGDEVEISYAGELSKDVTEARGVDVIISVSESEEPDEDPIISGTIEQADGDTLVLKDEEGNSYTFNSMVAQQVTKDGVKAGTQADVTYIGDLEDTVDKPMAVKIVTEDAMDTEDAEINALSGIVAEMHDSNNVVLETKDGSFFTFVSDNEAFKELTKGAEATIIYDGTLTGKAVHGIGVK